MINQFYTICRGCGKQILMTRCEDTGRWVPCNPVIGRYKPSGGPLTYVNTDGKLVRGTIANDGEFGYRKHVHRGGVRA